MSAPSIPLIKIRPKATNGKLEFWWDPPASDGGSAILSYTLACASPALTYSLPASAPYYYAVSGLTNGTEYEFTLKATNANGDSPTATFRSVQPGNKPGVPQTVVAIIASPTITRMSWTAPASDGGATVKWYVLYAIPTSNAYSVVKRSRSGTSTSGTLTGLNSSATYDFYVRAVNDPGYSAYAVATIASIYTTGLLVHLDGSTYTSGSTWYDLTANNNDATLENGTATKSGNALVLDGSTNWLLPALGAQTQYTVSVWFKLTAALTGQAESIIVDRFNGNNDINFAITNTGGNADQLFCGFFNQSSSTFSLPFSFTPSLNTWYNIAYSIDGGLNMAFYINGVPSGTYAAAFTPGSGDLGIRIGRRWDTAFYITGLIGEVLIYDNAIGDSNVLNNYNVSAGKFT